MDEIQKVLIKSGRKDLAQEYHNKISQIKMEASLKDILNKIKKILEAENVEELPKTFQQRLIEETAELLKFDPTKGKYIISPNYN
jgi:predicted kinase